MDMKLGDGLKKLVLMGIGAAALTAEKSQQIVDELVKRGEITVEQGKELNQELKRNVKKSFDDIAAEAEVKKAEAEKAKVSVRNARRELIEGLKKAVKDGMPEDAQKDGEEKVQKLHDKYLKKIDEVFAAKEKEILTV